MEIDDPLNVAADNANATVQAHVKHIEDYTHEKVAVIGHVDLEKGSVPLETRRHSRESTREKETERRREKAVVRIEIHDTGVGLKKQDVIE